jgi:hypothetical protein
MDNILFVETIIDETSFRPNGTLFRPRGFCITKSGDVYTTSLTTENFQDLQAYGFDIKESMYGLFRNKSENELTKISLDYLVEKFGNSDLGKLALIFLRERQIKSILDE